MFARTERLLLRPAWIDDAPALAAAFRHLRIARTASSIAPPYMLEDAHVFIAQPAIPTRPRLLILARGGAAPELVGGIGLWDVAGAVSLGYWIHPDHRERGYATEAGQAMLDIATMLGIARLIARHRLDNPASGAVLAKLGFRTSSDLHLVRGPGDDGGKPPARHMVRSLGTDHANEALAA